MQEKCPMLLSHNKYGKRIIFFFQTKGRTAVHNHHTAEIQKTTLAAHPLQSNPSSEEKPEQLQSREQQFAASQPLQCASTGRCVPLPPWKPSPYPHSLLFLQKDLHQPIAQRRESRENGCWFLYGSARCILFPRTQVKTNAGSAGLSLLPKHVVSSHRHMSQPFHRLEGAGSRQHRERLPLAGREERAKSGLHPRIATPDLRKEVSS